MRLLAVAILLGGLIAGGCGSAEDESILGKRTWAVGVRPDLPGLGLKRPDGTFEGFDVDVARYIGGKLGRNVTFVQALAADRIPKLVSGEVDLMVAAFSVTPDRKNDVAFAGPYYVSYQDILVRSDDTAIKDVRDLNGRKICAVSGTDAAQKVAAMRGVSVQITSATDYDRCMALLRDRAVDALTTNDVILAGLVKREGKGVRLVSARYAEQRTGIGLRKGDPDGCEAVNKAITEMYQDGTAAQLVGKWFGGTGLNPPIIAVPQFEGCD
ncbi:transporter substrate-binding domain-containing protein [Spirillospora sp. NPDC048911]|uniref:transporter substrate-binding domain-containing protein n=1 Tax=Spirillospora sp. NPDC048911 TaxID=3364527 RepID=UPI003717DC03